MTIRIRQNGERFLLPVKVTPKAGKNCILPYNTGDESVKLKVSAPPEDGKANVAVVSLLATLLKLPKSRIEVVSGHQAHHKQIALTLGSATTIEALTRQLAALLGASIENCIEMG